jgi:hypothetical protein
LCDGLIKGDCGAGLDLAKDLLEFGPGLFNRILVGRIGRQIEQLCLTGLDALTNSVDLVRTEIVHHHYIAGLQDRAQNLVQEGKEYIPVRSRLDGHGSDHATGAHCAQKGEDLPVAFRCALVHPCPTWSARIQTRHARGNTAFIQEDQLFRRDRAETFDKLFSPTAVFFFVPLRGVE